MFPSKLALLHTLPCTWLTAPTDFFESPLEPFIYTDLFTARSAEQNRVFAHFWQLEPTIIFGMKDTRAQNFLAGAQTVHDQGVATVIRNAGGLAVAADSGVLNFSLIFPLQPDADAEKFSIDDGYEVMFELIRNAFATPETPIEAFEVATSYCPGEYDLSIHGKKFAGLAQRRVKNGISVMAYLSISGDQTARGATIRTFYQAALGTAYGTDGYPAVDPAIMENLSTLLGTELTVATVKKRLLQVLRHGFSAPIHVQAFADFMKEEDFAHDFATGQLKMHQRNQILQ